MKTVAWIFAVSVVAALQFTHALAQEPAPLHILRITPAGEDVTAERQIVIEFDRAVVPLGKMERTRREIPVEITPRVACEWRWISTTSLACQLGEEQALKRSTIYTVTVAAGGPGFDGQPVAQHTEHTFITQRPKVANNWFEGWQGPTTPKFSVAFDQPVTEASALKHLYFSSGEQKVRTPIELKKIPDLEEPRYWVQPASPLPPDTDAALRVEPGLEPEAGGELGIEDVEASTFRTIPEFKFLEVVCYDLAGEKVAVAAGVPAEDLGKCDPLNSISLRFSSPVMKEAVKDKLTMVPALRGTDPEFDPWNEVYSYPRMDYPYTPEEDYLLALPYGLKAAATYSVAAAANTIVDEFGRTLADPIHISFATDHRNPRLVLDHTLSTLESNVDSHIPLIVTNLSKITARYDMETSAGKVKNRTSTLKPYAVTDIAYPLPLEVRKFLGASSGVLWGTLESVPFTDNGSQWFFSQVTPFAIHVKYGHFNSLVWVTRFSDGSPVADAKVSIETATMQPFAALETLATATTDANGIAVLPGTEKIDPEITKLHSYDYKKPGLLVRVSDGKDIGVVPAHYSYQVYSQVWARANKRFGHMDAWGTTAQGIYRAGDTMQFKVFVRNHDNQHFIPAPRQTYTLKIIDPLDKAALEVPKLTLSEFGAFSGEFAIPKNAVMGWYRFELTADFTAAKWEPLRVLVTDFTPAPFKVTSEIPSELVRDGDDVRVQTAARLHAGGPYAAAGYRVTGIVRSGKLEAADAKHSGFTFNPFSGTEMYASESIQVHQSEGMLDDAGNGDKTFKATNNVIVYGSLDSESAVRDDRGKYIAATATRPYAARTRFVGLKQDRWMISQGEPYAIQTLVVDERGAAQAGTAVKIVAERNEVKASRVKTSGNFYDTKYEEQWIQDGECKLTSALAPLDCQLTPSKPGSYRITATIKDTQDREHATVLYTYASGSGEVLWESSPTTQLKILSEKKTYATGETARFMIQNPFPNGKALLTVERYGIVKSWVQDFKQSVEVIELPITADDVPGFYLSAVVVSPRVEQPLTPEGIDLGKPSFRLGYIQVNITDSAKEITVKAAAERDTYKPREHVKVALQAVTPRRNGEPVEFAVTVLDEAVFDLIAAGALAFDPYRGFYSLSPVDVMNFNLLQQLIGRQKFEKKGANPGGDGGSDQDLRSLFKFVSYWNPSIRADADGKAQIEFDAPDNLTGWKVLAIAVTPSDQMGLGSAKFTVNKPIEIRSALPNQLLEGDRATARFTVMNRTDKPLTLAVSATVTGAVTSEVTNSSQTTVQADPFKRVEIALPVHAAAVAAQSGQALFKVSASGGGFSDAVELPLPVLPAIALETAATFATTTDDVLSEKLLLPSGIRPDAGELKLQISPSLLGKFEKIFQYGKDYPYLCWEQRLTKATLAAFYLALKQYLPAAFTWSEAKELPAATLAEMSAFQAPNGAMTYYKPLDQYASPYLSAYTALALSWLSENGAVLPQEPVKKLHSYLLRALREKVFPDYYNERTTVTVRTVILAALAKEGSVDAQDVLRLKDQRSQMGLFAQSHYLEALDRVKTQSPQVRLLAKQVLDQILSSADESAGKLVFAEPNEMREAEVLDSQTRSQCAILSALMTHAAKLGEGADAIGLRAIKLAQAIERVRGGKEHWLNTQENMFCLRALAEYSRVYEKDPVSMTLQATLGSESLGSGALRSLQDPPVVLVKPITPEFAKLSAEAAALTVQRSGTGRWYQTTRLTYAPLAPGVSAINSGIEVRREYSVQRGKEWVLLKPPIEVKQGELVKVSLYMSLPAARHFVVVSDPVPAGLEPVNRELATGSKVDADSGESDIAAGSIWYSKRDWIYFSEFTRGFYHREMGNAAVRFYSEYLNGGNYSLSYAAQAIAPGTFSALPVHAEEMYDPEVFGTWMTEMMNVQKAE